MTTAIAVLGAGSWGTALAAHLARCKHLVTLWGRSPDAIEEIRNRGCNQRYLPDARLPENLSFSSDLDATVATAQVVVVAVPSSHFESLIDAIKPQLTARSGCLLYTSDAADE